MENFSDYISIPEKFWSFETGTPFSRCALCSLDLTESGTNYIIEKAFAKGEVVFEHSICLDCRNDMYNELSEDSKRRIGHYFDEHVDIGSRQKELLEKHGTNSKKWIDHCLIKNTPVEELEEYQLYGYCIDSDLVFTGAPYILSGQAIDDIMNLLSPETRGVVDELSEKLFGIDLPQGFVMI